MINKPPRLPFMIVCSAACGVILTWASYPYWYGPEMFLFAVPVGWLLLAYWAIRMVWTDHKGTLPNSWPRFTISEPYYVCDGSNYADLDANTVPGSAEFVVEDWFLDDNKGFLWLPSGEPDETADDSYRHLKDRWYGFEGWDHW